MDFSKVILESGTRNPDALPSALYGCPYPSTANGDCKPPASCNCYQVLLLSYHCYMHSIAKMTALSLPCFFLQSRGREPMSLGIMTFTSGHRVTSEEHDSR